jgi:hypothetical protein
MRAPDGNNDSLDTRRYDLRCLRMSVLILLRGAIARYVSVHPQAVDTLEGIRDWWLSDIEPKPSDSDLEAVLEILVSEKLLMRMDMVDGAKLYGAMPQDNGHNN